jgi:hypothetical protein
MIITLFLAFTVRYYAAFYPLISLPILLFSKTKLWVKAGALGLLLALTLSFVLYTENLYKQLIGRREFSPFSGWQLASNALIMYRHISDRNHDIPPPELQPLHMLVIRTLKSFPPPEIIPDRDLHFFFAWKRGSPLVTYSGAFYGIDPTTEDLRKWAAVGKLYHEYGTFLIEKHPVAFMRFYVGQGIDWFINPKRELVNEYPEGGLWVTDRTKQWLNYKSNWLACTTSDLLSIAYFPAILTLLNVLFIISVIGYFYCNCHRITGSILNSTVILALIYWLANFFFIIISAPFLLRYGLSTMVFNIVLIPLILGRIFKTEQS